MGSFGHNWGALAWVLGDADTWVTLSGTTESASSDIDFETSGELGAYVTVQADFDSTPTDYINVLLYGSDDGTNYRQTPYATRQINKAVDPNGIDLVLDGNRTHHKVVCVQTGSTDSHNVKVSLQKFTGETA